jgi:DNA invertase Pin-like site-specific DNA recombinase
MSAALTPRNNPAPQGGVVLGGAWRPDKVQPWHYDRLAIVYVRQSDPHQVLTHQESTRLQYGLTARAADLGWSAERVLVIDDDLGKSGTTTEGRSGFQRMVSEVSLDHVGIILGVEMSRLARSCKDWYQLLEICALFGTLLADLDGIYDPAQYNDRLLLGLKGTMSEAELHIMQQRLRQGLLAKARRGELHLIPPLGYVQRASGEIALDPDEQVQAVLRLIFRKFAELGTVHALLRYLVAQQIQLGMRAHSGPERGEVVWHRPSRGTLQTILKHPMYAGAYVYGRRPVDPRRKKAGRPDTGRLVAGPAAWQVLLKDRLPAYISWDEYEANLARLQANRVRADTLGTVREGPALLTRLVVCAYCGRRMAVSYADEAHYAYACARMRIDYGAACCQHLAGAGLDAFVSQQVLAALEPAGLELSLEAATHLEQERGELDRLWQQRLERARYEAERAGRQYRLVEPENRLVARQLEREWEEKLAAQCRLEDEYRRFRQTQPRGLRADERAAIRLLAADIPALWHAPTTTAAERKELIRQVVTRVVVAVQGESERVQVTIDWVGGTQTVGTIVRPVARLEQLSYYPQLCARVRQLAAEGLAAGAIAQRLNAEGYRPPKRRERFGAQGVEDLLVRLGVRTKRSHSRPRAPLGPYEWGLRELAQAIGMSHVTLYDWVYRSWVRAHREEQAPYRWVLWADEAEIDRLRQRHQRSLSEEHHRQWVTMPPVAQETEP